MSMKAFPGAIILAAGTSGRMGEHKALLRFNEEKSFIENIIFSLSESGCTDIVLVVNPDLFNQINKSKYINNYKVKVVVNDSPEAGRFRSLRLGLNSITDDNGIFVHNCDNPFCNPFILKKMFRLSEVDSYVTPVFKNKGGHPVLIGSKICDELKRITDDKANLKEILNAYKRINYITDDPCVVFNINTPEEYNYFNKKTQK